MKREYKTPNITTIKEVPLFGLTREQEDRLLIIEPGSRMFLMPYKIAKPNRFRDRWDNPYPTEIDK